MKVKLILCESSYRVELNGEVIGKVASIRTTSYRQWKGVRYTGGVIGHPLHWDAYGNKAQVGYHFTTRKAAVQALIEHRKPKWV